MRKLAIQLAIIACLSPLVSSCGQKGPLILPEEVQEQDNSNKDSENE